MDIIALIDDYKELLDKKAELAELTAENNKAIEAAKNELTSAMIDNEMPKVSRGGFLYSLQDKIKYNKRAGDQEEFLEWLEGEGLDSIIKRTVDPRTLSSAISEIVEGNDGELPEGYEDYISVYQYFDIAKRKETNNAAKNAKKKGV